ncbi:hypothetical protein E6R62_33545 [Streptomyces sp. A1136]|nr:hypothetical protein E6R62_33545 [Streptomyces sp. A1136]
MADLHHSGLRIDSSRPSAQRPPTQATRLNNSGGGADRGEEAWEAKLAVLRSYRRATGTWRPRQDAMWGEDDEMVPIGQYMANLRHKGAKNGPPAALPSSNSPSLRKTSGACGRSTSRPSRCPTHVWGCWRRGPTGSPRSWTQPSNARAPPRAQPNSSPPAARNRTRFCAMPRSTSTRSRRNSANSVNRCVCSSRKPRCCAHRTAGSSRSRAQAFPGCQRRPEARARRISRPTASRTAVTAQQTFPAGTRILARYRQTAGARRRSPHPPAATGCGCPLRAVSRPV